MKVIVFVKATPGSESGEMPSERALAMVRLIIEQAQDRRCRVVRCRP